MFVVVVPKPGNDLSGRSLHVPFAELVKLLSNPDAVILEINNYNHSDDFVPTLYKVFEAVSKLRKLTK